MAGSQLIIMYAMRRRWGWRCPDEYEGPPIGPGGWAIIVGTIIAAVVWFFTKSS